ncbi:MAG: 30S ribosomal protein S7 [Parcubacteria group bacterium GW2011_GWC2_45_7]|nr:MAG: 30S ribosomal protein S7 [Parcubacteria group bacterium GW2011_GWC2_45_7]KKU73543.1 MAG: 30S ribosomal protein S7 [Parcubacteria group bacterium GW2011_GWA2_47_26]
MRHKKAPKRIIAPDLKYGSTDVAKFINYLMERGKKSTATRILHDAFGRIADVSKQNPVEIFDEAMKNVGPMLEVRSRRVGGANYQIPFPVRTERRFFLAAQWILGAARGRKGAPMANKLAEELMNAAKGEGAAIKKKQDVQKMAEANKAFAHFAR